MAAEQINVGFQNYKYSYADYISSFENNVILQVCFVRFFQLI